MISSTCQIHYLFPFESLLPWIPEVGNMRWINHSYRFKLNIVRSVLIFTSLVLRFNMMQDGASFWKRYSSDGQSSRAAGVSLPCQTKKGMYQSPLVVIVTCQTCLMSLNFSPQRRHNEKGNKGLRSEDRRPLVRAEAPGPRAPSLWCLFTLIIHVPLRGSPVH